MAADEFEAGAASTMGFATDAELAAHTDDTTDAHDASAISFAPTGTIAGTDVQTAVAEVATDAAAALTTHEADTTSVHGITNTGTIAFKNATNVFTGANTFSSTFLAEDTATFQGPVVTPRDTGSTRSLSVGDAIGVTTEANGATLAVCSTAGSVNPGVLVGTASTKYAALQWLSTDVARVISTGGGLQIQLAAGTLGFYGATPIAKPTVSGSRAIPEQALADLLTELANLGIITNSTTI